MTLEEARKLAEAELPALRERFGCEDIVIADNPVGERQRGWSFAYNTKRFQETRNPIDGLVGNGPIFVDKSSGKVFVMPSGGWKNLLVEYDIKGVMPDFHRPLRWVGEGAPQAFPEPRKT